MLFRSSDVDIILVSKSFEGIAFTERMSRMYAYWEGEVPLEVICYTPEEFERKKRQIGTIKTAVREGKKLTV